MVGQVVGDGPTSVKGGILLLRGRLLTFELERKLLLELLNCCLMNAVCFPSQFMKHFPRSRVRPLEFTHHLTYPEFAANSKRLTSSRETVRNEMTAENRPSNLASQEGGYLFGNLLYLQQ